LICEQTRKIDIRDWKGGWPIVQLPNGHIVEVTSTPCNFGRERVWFVCPGCGRRCAILYPWACRTCSGGRYESELLSPENRLMRKAFALRRRLGQTSGGLFGFFPDKPKGLHWSTYNRLVAEGEAMERQLMSLAAARFGLAPNGLF
jgi:hypothetical protein